MKLLFITPSFEGGGAEKNMLNIINQLDGYKFDIHLIICTDQSAYLRQLNKSIKVHSLKKANVKGALFSVISIIRSIKPNIVFTSALHLSTPILLYKKIVRGEFKKITRIPTLPSNKLGENNIKTSLLRYLNNKLLNSSTYVIAQTEQMKDEIIEYYGVEQGKVVVIDNIVDTVTIKRLADEDIELPAGYRYIASGSLYSVKGFDLLIKAFATHVISHPTDRLFIIGKETIESGYKYYLEQIIDDLKLNDNVFLLGFQSNPYKYYKSADAFVLSSLKEGFPNVVLENMVLGVPVLVTDCVNFTEIINSTTGVIVEKGSVEELIKGLELIRGHQKYNVAIQNFNFNHWFKKISS